MTYQTMRHLLRNLPPMWITLSPSPKKLYCGGEAVNSLFEIPQILWPLTSTNCGGEAVNSLSKIPQMLLPLISLRFIKCCDLWPQWNVNAKTDNSLSSKGKFKIWVIKFMTKVWLCQSDVYNYMFPSITQKKRK